MQILTKAICWALALIVLAVLSRSGLIADDVVRTMLIVMPVVAVTTMFGANRCLRHGRV